MHIYVHLDRTAAHQRIRALNWDFPRDGARRVCVCARANVTPSTNRSNHRHEPRSDLYATRWWWWCKARCERNNTNKIMIIFGGPRASSSSRTHTLLCYICFVRPAVCECVCVCELRVQNPKCVYIYIYMDRADRIAPYVRSTRARLARPIANRVKLQWCRCQDAPRFSRAQVALLLVWYGIAAHKVSFFPTNM